MTFIFIECFNSLDIIVGETLRVRNVLEHSPLYFRCNGDSIVFGKCVRAVHHQRVYVERCHQLVLVRLQLIERIPVDRVYINDIILNLIVEKFMLIYKYPWS